MCTSAYLGQGEQCSEPLRWQGGEDRRAGDLIPVGHSNFPGSCSEEVHAQLVSNLPHFYTLRGVEALLN